MISHMKQLAMQRADRAMRRIIGLVLDFIQAPARAALMLTARPQLARIESRNLKQLPRG